MGSRESGCGYCQKDHFGDFHKDIEETISLEFREARGNKLTGEGSASSSRFV